MGMPTESEVMEILTVDGRRATGQTLELLRNIYPGSVSLFPKQTDTEFYRGRNVTLSRYLTEVDGHKIFTFLPWRWRWLRWPRRTQQNLSHFPYNNILCSKLFSIRFRIATLDYNVLTSA